jgi:hypothetical protein
MLTVTLSQLREAVRDRSDTTNSARVTNTKLDRAINSSIRRLHSMLVQASDDDYTTRAAIITDADGAVAVLPNDFLSLRSIGWASEDTGAYSVLMTEADEDLATEDGEELLTEDSSDVEAAASIHTEPMERFQLAERHRYTRDGARGWCDGDAIAYRLIGPLGTPKQVEFLPAAGERKLVVVWYIPEPATLTDATDTYDGRTGWEEWVVWDAAIAIMTAEESDTRAATAERDRVWQMQIAPLAQTHDKARPNRVIDVEGSRLDWPGSRWRGRL